MTATESRQVSWWPCHEFLQAVVDQANLGPLPAAGTPSWCELGDDDPRKLLALAEAGVLYALRRDCAQTALAEASRDVAASTDWASVARGISRREAFYAERPWLRRVTL